MQQPPQIVRSDVARPRMVEITASCQESVVHAVVLLRLLLLPLFLFIRVLLVVLVLVVLATLLLASFVFAAILLVVFFGRLLFSGALSSGVCHGALLTAFVSGGSAAGGSVSSSFCPLAVRRRGRWRRDVVSRLVPICSRRNFCRCWSVGNRWRRLRELAIRGVNSPLFYIHERRAVFADIPRGRNRRGGIDSAGCIIACGRALAPRCFGFPVYRFLLCGFRLSCHLFSGFRCLCLGLQLSLGLALSGRLWSEHPAAVAVERTPPWGAFARRPSRRRAVSSLRSTMAA
mmetsp:Transcript_19587/g.59257  ORF Transcript_19587/g.59257 Transcript_19587/m.59257 type:complete len:288 (-) Transcript_19587:529-1392(-)